MKITGLRFLFALLSLGTLPVTPLLATPVALSLVPDQVAPVVPDRQLMQSPDAVRLTGRIGLRMDASEANRLVQLDPERLLDGYKHRPGRQEWEGEHIGKWLHAATLAWASTGDPALRAKLDLVVRELMQCQLADGYLGTYLPENRWTAWDVWAHKYNLIGLIAYMRYTGDLTPLDTCRRMGDLLCATFGDEPGKRDLIAAGYHTGLAPTSVLEPMVLLYRFTGEPRYLAFCRYILRAWEQPNGPKIVSTLLTQKRVDRVGNGKAYEMLSCLNGALELYRTTGDRDLLQACLNAWADIEQNRLYLTGTASYHELFRDDHDLPNVSDVGETCVTVTWLQLNAQLLRLTGEARFAQELERVVLNQLLGAQSPDCLSWGYYVQMQGKKPYASSLTGNCCLSSGPRGVALIGTFAVSTDADGVVVNLFDAGTAHLVLPDRSAVSLRLATTYPADGHVRITITPTKPSAFALKFRVPDWSARTSITVNGTAQPVVDNGRAQAAVGPDGYYTLRRTWSPGDTVDLQLTLAPRLIVGDHLNAGKAALLYGPLVLAADSALLPPDVENVSAIVLPGPDIRALGVTPEPAPERLKTWAGSQVFRVHAAVRRTTAGVTRLVPCDLRFTSFADAGGFGSTYQVWTPLAGTDVRNVLVEGVASSSAPEAVPADLAAINDGDENSTATIHGGPSRAPQWFAVTLPEPVTIRRVAFLHGVAMRSGGWFDTSAGRPAVQVQREKGGAWIAVGEFGDYPATTARDGGELQRAYAGGAGDTTAGAARANRKFTFTIAFPQPETVVAVRVIGLPSTAGEPGSTALACAELQAFAE